MRINVQSQNYIPAIKLCVIITMFLIDGTGETLLTAVGTAGINAG